MFGLSLSNIIKIDETNPHTLINMNFRKNKKSNDTITLKNYLNYWEFAILFNL